MGGFKSARRFTLSDTNDLTLYNENISKARIDLSSSRFVHRISDEHLCVSDSENTKPSWLEVKPNFLIILKLYIYNLFFLIMYYFLNI